MHLPDLSVVVPTYNRLGRIQKVLDALARQDYLRDAFEVIVVSDGSTDGTNEYLASLSHPCHIRSLIQANQGPAVARNAGISIAKGNFIVFIDDDVVPEPNCLSEHMRAHASATRDVAVIGPLLTPSEFKLSPWVNWEQEMLAKQYIAMTHGTWVPTARQFYTGNASVRRDLLLSVGGFDANFRRAEDVELAYRLAERGVDFVFTMAAAGVHYAERSFKSWLETASAYGRNDAIFARDRKQEWLFPAIREEFGLRRRPLRLLISACMGRPRFSAMVVAGARGVSIVAGRLALPKVEAAAYSALFGVRYYQGFLDEIGQPDFFVQVGVPPSA